MFFLHWTSNITELLRHASTFDLEARVRKCTLQLQDENLLAKLSTGDFIALEAKYMYHGRCLVSLCNRAKQETEPEDEGDISAVNQGIALAELITKIEDARTDSEHVSVFKPVGLVKMHSTRLEQLGTCLSMRVNSTRLKTRILPQICGLTKKVEMFFFSLMKTLGQQ